jgi:sec-independent protein translocase protein TatC
VSQSEDTIDPDSPQPTEEMRPGTMSFRSHLEELRKRVIVSMLAVGVCMFGFLLWQDAVMGVLLDPYQESWRYNFSGWYEDKFETQDFDKLEPDEKTRAIYVRKLAEHQLQGKPITDFDWAKANSSLRWFGFGQAPSLIYTTPLQYFMVFMIAAAIFGLILASPVVLIEMWKFIGAGLYKKERRAVMKLVPFSMGLFAAGVTFGYKIMVPFALVFLTSFSNPRIGTPLFTMSDYFRFLFILTVALGAVFQMPLIMMGLTKFGITTPGLYIKYWRHCILAMFVMSALLTPPDPVTQVLMAGPMLCLFGLGILLSKMTYRKQVAAAEEAVS